jgi:hypothetical protein
MNEIITTDYFPGQDCHCEARSSYECGCDADWTPTEVYKLREDAKQLADRLTALELHSTSELARLEQERDDALSQIAQAEKRAERYCQERDEARDAIVGWENKWKCAIDMAARAELERDDARELAQQMSESNQVLQAEVRDYRKKEKLKP